jgi:SAM-dependent methyltransferase
LCRACEAPDPLETGARTRTDIGTDLRSVTTAGISFSDLLFRYLSIATVMRMGADRRQGSSGDAYVLPRHPAELDRLDVQHYALREALGTNYLAPVQRPRLVVDVGAGTGQWAYDLCRKFPQALVIGLDLEPGKPGAPPNYRGVRANVLQGLPFGDDRLDFVHQRLLFSGVPVASWPTVVAELVRTVRPGGWVELVEGATQLEPVSPASDRLCGLLRRLGELRGLDSTGIVFDSLDDYLIRAGATMVTKQTAALPVGEWGGRIGSLMASDMRALFTRLGPAFDAALGVPAADSEDLVRDAQEEWEEHHTTYSFAVAYGQKPRG